MPDDPYSLGDLARLADVTPRTVRYYVAQGLLPSPDAAGPATRYGEGHLARLRLIKRLQRDHLPLAEIRARLERMADDEVAAAAAVLDPVEPDPSMEAGDTLDFVRSLMRQSGIRSTTNHTAVQAMAAPAPVRAPARPSAQAGPSALAAPPAIAPAEVPPPAARRAARPSFLAHRLEAVHEAAPEAPAPPPAAAAAAPAPAAAPSMTPADRATSRTPPAIPPPLGAALAPPGAGPRTLPDRTTWERLVISADVELHVRRPLDRQTNKRVDQLERIARELFEDP